jgi:hypothetical protein
MPQGVRDWRSWPVARATACSPGQSQISQLFVRHHEEGGGRQTAMDDMMTMMMSVRAWTEQREVGKDLEKIKKYIKI